MSLKAFLEVMLSRLLRVRNACNKADTEHWATVSHGCNSGAFLVGALEADQRDRIDYLIENAKTTREAELAAMQVAA
ncbi:MAG: hypothetical protein KKB36_13050 [Gammaproteobacteria bacterium]|uniref:Uncharacterized protein n=1 Tax=viral metagenome TaxID=1070528 RepID=A0A6M3M6K0_9ZZZZ|nr:hypothetical protein [Gammaproteobacteria bacterium]MBU0883281.1 hypothetical protein [Gammaproteobacteria bacterium]